MGVHLSNSRTGRSALSGVVAMSGSSLSQYSYDTNANETVLQVAKSNNCTYLNETVLLKCLRGKSVEDIIKHDTNLQNNRMEGENFVKSLSAMSGLYPTLEISDDQRSLPGMIVERPEEAMKKEPENKIPLLIGCTQHETANALDMADIKKTFKTGTEFLKSVQESFKISKLGSINITSIVGAFSAVPGIFYIYTVASNFKFANIYFRNTFAI